MSSLIFMLKVWEQSCTKEIARLSWEMSHRLWGDLFNSIFIISQFAAFLVTFGIKSPFTILPNLYEGFSNLK